MAKTEVLICFDTEDFTCDRSNDAIRDTALLLTEEGVRGNYQMVGYVAQNLIKHRRHDVLDALKPHVINSHTKGHSVHPNIAEATDIEDMYEAIKIAEREENDMIGMIKAATGTKHVLSGCPPGSSFTAAAMYAYANLGMPVYSDTAAYLPDYSSLWFCGLLNMPYYRSMESMFFSDAYDEQAILDDMAKYRRVLVYNHPNMIEHTQCWDKVNYDRENKAEWGKWEEAPLRSPELVIRFYTRMRSLIRAIKADDRFVFTDTEEIAARECVSRTVKRADMPKYLTALKASLYDGKVDPLVLCVENAVHISLSECLYAAAKMLLGADEVCLDGHIAKGFLAEPVGVPCEVKVPLGHIARCAKSLDFNKFLPNYYICGTYRIGPMDLLTALLECVCDPSKLEVTIKPKPQQASLDRFPRLRDLHTAGTWVFTPEFEDKYTTDRLRLQAWTMRN